jgi:putative hydrolase of the HAD superfamily
VSPPARDTVISDFGGVLTSPLIEAFAGVQATAGVPLDALGRAMAAGAVRDGVQPLAELETGRVTEAEFLRRLEDAMEEDLGERVSLDGFAEAFWGHLHPNSELFEYYRELRARGVALAICTNNVREWEARWRAMLPIDEIFDVVVDSAFVGVRKPDPEIYQLTLERLGRPASAAVFVDDIEANVEGARALGMEAVRFVDTAQAIAAIEAGLSGG